MPEVIHPQLVVDHRSKEKDTENLILATYFNNVRIYLTTMQDKIINLDKSFKDGTTYNMQRFNTQICNALKWTLCAYFLVYVKTQMNEWIKNPDKLDTLQTISNMTIFNTN